MRQHYTPKQLANAYIRDLVSDIRCAIRDGLPGYADECRKELAGLWTTRHNPNINKWGRPIRVN